MFMRTLLMVTLLAAVNTCLQAQSLCPLDKNGTPPDKMICAVPNVYTANSIQSGNVSLANYNYSSQQRALNAIMNSVRTELTDLRLASPASGIIFTFDRSIGVITRSTESYGPILGERAETLGRHHLFVAATYQFFPFSTVDGIDLKHFPSVYTAADPAVNPGFLDTTTRVDLKVHQVTFYATYGLTNRIDVSAAIPYLHVHMGITSIAQVFGTPGQTAPTLGTGHATLAWDKVASGIGDAVFRLKGTVFKGERGSVAVGADVRVPSGDEENLLGSGAAGFKPFVTATYRARVSPHVNLGYEFNGSSILGGNLATGQKGRLPDQFFYAGGADVRINRRVTGAVDLLGQRLFGASRVIQTNFTDSSGNVVPGISQTVSTHHSFNMNDLAVGAKYNPFGKWLLTGNVQFRLDDGGLRARVVPLAGIAYTF